MKSASVDLRLTSRDRKVHSILGVAPAVLMLLGALVIMESDDIAITEEYPPRLVVSCSSRSAIKESIPCKRCNAYDIMQQAVQELFAAVQRRRQSVFCMAAKKVGRRGMDE